MMLLALYAFILLMTMAVVYYFMPYQIRKAYAVWLRLEDKTAHKVDALFIKNSRKVARFSMPISLIVLTLFGFFLPGGQTGFDRFLLDNAVSLNKHGYYEQTLVFLSGLRKGKSPLLHSELGIAYQGLGDIEDATRNMKIAVKLYPGYAQAYANLAYLYELSKRHTDADFARKRSEILSKQPVNTAMIYGGVDETPILLRLIFAAIFGWLGFKLPGWVLAFLKARRIRKYDKQLPDALGIVASALRAGLSLPKAMEVVVKQMRPPINQEFGLVLKQYKLGKSIDEAVTILSKQMDTEDTGILISMIGMLSKTGGDMTQGLENVAYVIRERWRVKEKIKSMTAEGKAQAIIVSAIPVVVGLMLNKFLPETFSLMYTTTLGWIIMLLMIIWGGIGVFLMWKMTQVKI